MNKNRLATNSKVSLKVTEIPKVLSTWTIGNSTQLTDQTKAIKKSFMPGKFLSPIFLSFSFKNGKIQYIEN